jgi:acyl-CoA reductase-like NAD-dependent aldehyde dehydrogenase
MKEIVNRQRNYFNGNVTKPIAFRIAQLKTLKAALLPNERLIDTAIAADVGKSRFENILTELYIVHDEIDVAVSNLASWARAQPVKVDPLNEPADCYIVPEPLGVSLVIGPWNYPFQQALAPVVAAVAAACTVVLKPCELMPRSKGNATGRRRNNTTRSWSSLNNIAALMASAWSMPIRLFTKHFSRRRIHRMCRSSPSTRSS